ncbi:hypothetical protein N431DRAFT_424811 [Stipitochalara longipes BDJ]|nr:hypothetical protein N431DRAFT_424811 [Stipitochalara longipes BDJ]
MQFLHFFLSFLELAGLEIFPSIPNPNNKFVDSHEGNKYDDFDFAARNLKTIQSIYNLTVYPNNAPIQKHGSTAVPPGLFNENATGRITPLGNFTGFVDSIEYFFGLAPTPSPPKYDVISAADIVAFTSGCAEVAASVVYLTTSAHNPGAPSHGQFRTKLKQVAFWRFDPSGAVINYDAWIPNLSLWVNIMGADFTSPPARAATIGALCATIQQRCAGDNLQYESVASCVDILGKRNFGSWDEVWGDNVVCRSVHVGLTKMRPEVHCPHVGPTGAMKCVDMPYNKGYFDDQILFGLPEGDAFTCT